jgi:hypothetical protein
MIVGGDATTGTVTNSGTLSIGGNASTSTIANAVNASFSVAGALTTNGADVSNDGTLSVGGAATTGNIANTGSLTIYGDATTGTLTNSGTLGIGGNANTGAIANATGATMTVTGGLTTNGANVGNDGTVSVGGAASTGTIANTGAMSFGSDLTSGVVTNSGTLGVSGSATTGDIANTGTMTIGKDLTGGTVTNSGSLAVGGNASTGAIANAAGGTMAVTGALTTNGADVSNDGKLSVGGTTATGNIANTGTLTLADAAQIGTLTNSGTATLGGATTAGAVTNSGYLIQNAALTSSGDVANTSGAQWNLGADLTAAGTVTNDGAMVVTSSGNTITTTGFGGASTGVVGLGGMDGTATNALTIDQSGNSTYAGVFTGAGSLVKQGAGTLTLTGASDFTGGLTVAAGTLDTTGGGTLADTLAIAVDKGATLIMGTSDLVGSIANAGTLSATADLGLTTLSNTGTATINALLAASGDVTNAASGAMTLASTATAQILGNLTNDGTLSSAGQLSVSGATANTDTLTLLGGSSTVLSSLANSGTLDALGSLTVVGAVNNSGSMTLDTGSTPVLGSLVNSGTILANDLLTVAGSFVQNAGTLTAKAGLTTGTLSGTGGSIDLAGSTYNLNQTADATYSGSVTGGGTVNKYGTGTLTLNGVADSFAASSLNIYAGGVTVATKNLLDSALDVLIDTAGTLTLQADQTIHDLTGTGTLNIGTSTLTLADGGSFDGTINGTGAIGTSAGTLDLNSAINNTGGSFTVGNGSTVNVGATGSITTTSLNVTGGTLDLSGTASATTTTLTNGATLHLGNGVDLDETGAEAGTLNSTTTTVNGGSSITGNGYVTGTVNVGGTTAGTIAPGNSPGILTFDTLNLGDNATAAMQVDGTAGAGNAGGNDLIIVKNALNLSGSSALTVSKSVSNDFALALGQGVQLFKFAEGKISGHFGSVSLADSSQNALLNLATGTLIGLGSYTPSTFTAAISTTPNQAAITKALMVSDNGGVQQYYGGNLMSYVTAALAANPSSVGKVFARWSPEAYAGITDQMKVSVLDNLPELGGYDKLTPGRTFAIGNWNRNGINGSDQAGYAQNRFRDDALNVGIAHQFGFGQLLLSYGHSDGNFYGANISDRTMGDQVGLGISAPVALGQALRVTGRFIYGGYTSKGVRATNSGSASFGGVHSNVFAYGAGLEYLKQAGKLRIDNTAEFIGMHERMNGFSEYGAGSAAADGLDLMSVKRMTHDAYIGRLGSTVGYIVSPVVEVYAKGTYDHEFGKRLTDIAANVSLESTDFTVANTGLSRDRFSAGGGVKVNATRMLQFNLDASAGVDASYRFGGGVRFNF